MFALEIQLSLLYVYIKDEGKFTLCFFALENNLRLWYVALEINLTLDITLCCTRDQDNTAVFCSSEQVKVKLF